MKSRPARRSANPPPLPDDNPGGRSDQALETLLNREMLGAVERLNRLAPIPLALLFFLLVQSDALQRHPLPLAFWSVAILAWQAVRWFLGRILRAAPDTRLDQLKLGMRLVSLVNALMFGSVVIFFADLTLAERAFVTLVIAGMGSAIISVTNGRPSVFWTFIFPTTLLLCTGWWLAGAPSDGSTIHLNFALLLLVFSGFQYFIGRGTFATFSQSVANALHAREANERLQEALASAEAASRAKTQFLASASHDLRQPLHTLSLLGGALLMQKLDPKAARIAANMNEAMQDLAAELDALLDISKLDAGVVSLHRESVPVSQVLERLREIHEPVATRRQLQIEFRHPPAPIHLYTDRQLLQRLLGNLIDNAIKYTDTGSIIVSAELQHGECVLTVADTGIGIAPDQQQRVFDEFYQIGNDARHRQRGLGLGLSIAQRLRRLLEADMVLESVVGSGTRIGLRLKTTASAARPCAEPPRTDDRSLNMKILVIDDEVTVRRAMRLVLEGMGATVLEAGTAREALRIARESRPDLALADLRLHGNDDGIHTVRRLREAHPKMRTLLISGDTAPDRLREAADAGLVLLHKPLSSAQLRAGIQHLDAMLPQGHPAKDPAD
ncbi:MAG: ATP-binding protein [Burkholderiaceae bacterium]